MGRSSTIRFKILKTSVVWSWTFDFELQEHYREWLEANNLDIGAAKQQTIRKALKGKGYELSKQNPSYKDSNGKTVRKKRYFNTTTGTFIQKIHAW